MPEALNLDAPKQEAQTLERLRWRVTQFALVIASVAMGFQFLLALLGSESTLYDPLILLATSLWFALWAIFQGTLRRVSPLVERSGYGCALAIFLDFYTRIMVGIFAGTRSVGEVGEIFPWFAIIYTAAFIIFSGKTALALCGGVVLYSSSLNAYFIGSAALSGGNIVALEASLDLFYSNSILLLMLFVLKRTTEAWARTHAHAQVLAQLANQDALTGLHNRRYLSASLAEEVERARRYAHPLSVALCDIDNFKAINDTFSHGVGDRVLQEVARLLGGNIRSVDTAVRYGGEEFVLVFPETDAQQAYVVCEKIRQAIEAHPWSSLHLELSVTLSVGVASLSAESGERDAEMLLSAADHKLYEAKRRGRNQVRL